MNYDYTTLEWIESEDDREAEIEAAKADAWQDTKVDRDETIN